MNKGYIQQAPPPHTLIHSRPLRRHAASSPGMSMSRDMWIRPLGHLSKIYYRFLISGKFIYSQTKIGNFEKVAALRFENKTTLMLNF
jgi:hypothetical protein